MNLIKTNLGAWYEKQLELPDGSPVKVGRNIVGYVREISYSKKEKRKVIDFDSMTTWSKFIYEPSLVDYVKTLDDNPITAVEE